MPVSMINKMLMDGDAFTKSHNVGLGEEDTVIVKDTNAEYRFMPAHLCPDGIPVYQRIG